MKRFLFLACICLLSCNAQKNMGEEIQGLVLVEQDGYSGVEVFEAREIRETKSLHRFYSQINKTRKPGLPVPMIDFSKEMVLLVCLGAQQGKPSVRLSKIKETDTEIFIGVVLEAKPQGPLATQTPFYLYKMPLVDKTVIFQTSD
ncbi:hypothetical protein [Flagellimonas amoyensis]|uniref:hypothetical protein n=1 Tax=Flagellimonas amoyensis TaxID=2169401 RepID=UPI000D37BC42|nr:hypothetical protein [Allomuricauda amoyensis]